MNKQQPHNGLKSRTSASFKFVGTAALLATASVFYFAVPQSANSQISSKQVSVPKFSATGTDTDKHQNAKGPAQAEIPAPPPVRFVPGLEEPLVATGNVTEQESKDLDAATAEYRGMPAKMGRDADFADYAPPLIAYIAAHPQSEWNSALQLDLGLGYYHAGYFSRAFTAFEQSWKLGQHATSPQAAIMVDRAVGELAKMHARVGHDKELEALFAEIGKRPIAGPATELIQGAREGLDTFKHDPGTAYLCGPRALENVLITLKATAAQIAVADNARSGEHGVSLPELSALADKARLKYKLIHREAGQPVPVPSVIHWKINHYAAVVGTEDGFYRVDDPTFGDHGSFVSLKAIEAESDGYFLVPAQAFKAAPKNNWRILSADSAEAKAVYGMGTITNTTPGATYAGGINDCPMCPIPEAGNRGSQNVTPAEPQGSGGMSVAGTQAMAVSLRITDTPIGYKPQKGATSARTAIFYNQREAMQPATFAFSNLSPKWAHSWVTYVVDDPNHPGASVSRITAGGGGIVYPVGYSNGGTYGFYPPEGVGGSVLRRYPLAGALPTDHYVRVLPDGTMETYHLFDGATTYPRKIFLTSIVDPAGNTTTLNYDSSFRLTSVVDPMGRSTTFTYGLTLYPLLITQITDGFGRSTQMTYDTSARLATVTDPVGIVSAYTYSVSEPSFITTLTTPYGTSTFSDTNNPNDPAEPVKRSLTVSDPLGDTDYLYLYQNTSVIPATDPAALIPTGMSAWNTLLNIRNVYYWGPHAFALGATTTGGVVTAQDFTKSRINHWIHHINFVDAYDIPENFKAPLENRVFIGYDGAPNAQNSGSIDLVALQGRVLDDGTSQETSLTYNGLGFPLTKKDPKGRITKYTYATNNIDLLTVAQLTTTPSTYTTIATYGSYNTLHEPQTYTDAAGKVWHYTYNTAGQLLTVTDPNTGVTTYNYDGSSRLSTVQNANLQTVLTLTYDSDDRVLTRTDSEGYVLTYGYDNLDRVTSITYPDATTDLYDYTFQSGPYVGTNSLEMRKHTDRLGRVTTYGYDAARRLTSVTEPTSGASTRTTSYAYYEDGTLKDIIDANGNDTHWAIDIESRPVSKTYQYGTPSATTETYAYENTTSRLHSITDALGQVKTFTYGLDDRITGIAYTSSINTTPNVTFAYDTYFPRLTSMVDGTGTTTYGYTAIGTNGALKLASVDGAYANDVIGLTYDAMGRLSGRTISGGNETFGYDPISRMTSHGTPLGSFTYTYLGQTDQTASHSVTNGAVTVSTSWGYDTNTNDRRLISIANSGVSRSYTFGYGTTPVNPYDIMSVTDTAASGHPWATQSRAYSYDNIDRLLTASSTTPGNDTYAYDKLDNATTYNVPGTGTSPTYNGFNQISTWGAQTYAYDANGNLTSGDGLKTYKYDAENRLIEIDYTAGGKTQFTYDGVGHRTVDVETASGGGTTTARYLWCGSNVCQTRDGSDTVLRRDLNEGEYNVSTSQKLVYMPDQLGSVRDVIDATTGTLVASYDFTPYGAVARSNVTNGTDYQYSGLFYHPVSALNLATYRAMDAVTGRWINRDPIRENGGINLYGYVKANTVNWTDQRGLGASIALPSIPMPTGSMIGRVAGTTAGVIGEGFGIFWPNEIAAPSLTDGAKECPKPEDLEGKTLDEVDDMMKGKGWVPSPTNSQNGTRYDNPDVKGQQVRGMPGDPAATDPVKQGPYGVISSGRGSPVKVPLAGNPTLTR